MSVVNSKNDRFPSNVTEIAKQFMCCVPVNSIAWGMDPGMLEEHEQENLVHETALHPTCQKYPISVPYQRCFFKKVVKDLEDNGRVVSEDIYNLYVKLLQEDSCSLTFRSYFVLQMQDFVSVLESRNFISNGTTGLTTWQGSMLMTEWCISNREILSGKRVLELGSGIGLAGIVICKVCKPSSYVFTDCHEDVMSLLDCNVRSNFDQNSTQNKTVRKSPLKSIPCRDVRGSPTSFKTGACKIKVVYLKWDEFNLDVDFATEIEPSDVILAADVVFDPSLVPGLVETLKALLLRSHQHGTLSPTAYFSLTVRNANTYDLFLTEVAKNNLTWEEIDSSCPSLFYYDKSSDIRLIQIKNKMDEIN